MRPWDLETSRPPDLQTSRPPDLETSRPRDLVTRPDQAAVKGKLLQVYLSTLFAPKSRVDLADLSSPVWSCCFFQLTLVHSVTLEYVANIQGPLCLSPFRSQAFRPEGNSFLSGELRYIDGSACDKGTPGTPPPPKQAAIPLARTYSSSSLSLP